jgi:hypothetical protein
MVYDHINQVGLWNGDVSRLPMHMSATTYTTAKGDGGSDEAS